MSPKQFRPIILKTLKEGKKFPNIEALADRIVEQMQTYEEMADLLIDTGSPILTNYINEKKIELQEQELDRRVFLPTDSVKEDPSERILPQTKTNPAALREYFTKDEIFEYLTEKLPPDIDVKPNGFPAPVKLFRRLQKAPGDLSFVKILYAPAGGNGAIEMQAATTDPKIDDVAILDSIRSQAIAVLSPSQRNVPPRMAIPPPQSLSPDPAFSAETDRETAPGDWNAWVGRK